MLATLLLWYEEYVFVQHGPTNQMKFGIWTKGTLTYIWTFMDLL